MRKNEQLSPLWRALAYLLNPAVVLLEKIHQNDQGPADGKDDISVAPADCLQTIIDGFEDELVVISPDFRVMQVNQAVLSRLGKPAAEITGQPCFRIHGSDEPCRLPWRECPLSRVLETGQPVRVIHTRKEGQADESGERCFEIVVSPVRDSQGRASQVIELVRDITESKRLKNELIRANRELRAVNSIAHALSQSLDLKTTLQAAAEGMLEALEAQLSWIQLSLSNGSVPAAWASRELSPEAANELIQSVSFYPSEQVATSATYTIMPANGLEPNLWQFAVTPLRSKGVFLGRAGVATTKRPVDQQRIQLLDAIGYQIAVAIERCRLYEEVQLARDMRGELLHRVITTQEDERRRIARELHDETGQALTALRLFLERLTLGPSISEEEIKSSLAQSLGLCQQADEEIDKLIFDLRPALLDDLGLVEAIDFYAQTRLKAAEIALNLSVTGEAKRLESEREVALFRVMQESVNNVIKHASAKNVTISLRFTPGRVVMKIRDDGCGFDTSQIASFRNPKCGLGLMGMKERLSLVGGSLSVWSQPGIGTRIRAIVPLDKEEDIDDN